MKTIKLKALALAQGGEFVCSQTNTEFAVKDEPQTKKVFVPYVCPNEVFEAQITEEEQNFQRAKLVRVLNSSKDRVKPTCPVFTYCGGCQLQHLSLQQQRKCKVEMVKSMLNKHAGVVVSNVNLLGDTLPGYAYRTKIQLHCDSLGNFGYYAPQSKTIINIDSCPIAINTLNLALKELKRLPKLISKCENIDIEYRDSQLCITFTARNKMSSLIIEEIQDTNPLFSLSPIFVVKQITQQQTRIFKPGQRIQTNIGHEKIVFKSTNFKTPFGHFVQINNEGNSILKNFVLNELQKHPSASVTELYAGFGNFGLDLASNGYNVNMVERDPILVRYGEKLAKEKNLTNKVKFYNEKCERYVLKGLLSNILLLDPPRIGAKEVFENLNQKTAKVVEKIIYISCNLPSLCRDLKMLLTRGFLPNNIFVLDMFPQTHFIEVITILTRQA